MEVSHIDLLVTILITLIGSSGFWLFLDKKRELRTQTRKLIMGIAYDRITTLCMHYIVRGYVTQDEYENLDQYLFNPYKELGGDGLAIRLKREVDDLPIKNRNPINVLKEERTNVHEQ